MNQPPTEQAGDEKPMQGPQQDPMMQFFKGILEPEAYERVANLYVLAKGGDRRKEALLKALYSYLQGLMARGYISRKIRDDELLALLKKLASQGGGSGGSIKIIHK